jgi:membrane protein YqaA with SNARE-associated domain
MRLAEHPRALWFLAFISFIESSVFPIPPDLLMIPLILAAPHRAWRLAGGTMVSAVAGGLLGYGIGALAFEQIGQPILEALGKLDRIEECNQTFNDAGFWAVLGAGITPFPYKVITIMAGWTSMPLATFVVTSILARGLRFFLVAGLLWYFGAPVKAFVERWLGLVFTLFFVALIGGFVLIKYL